MTQNLESGKWVYLKSNPEMVYRVSNPDSQYEIEVTNFKQERVLILREDLELITDVIKIQELDSAWEAELNP